MNVTVKLIDPMGLVTAPFVTTKKILKIVTRGRNLLKYSETDLNYLLDAALFL